MDPQISRRLAALCLAPVKPSQAASSAHWSALSPGGGPSSAASSSGLEHEDACGIIAYVGKDTASDYLLEGLTILQNRGYDSAGIATVDSASKSLVVSKFASQGSTSDAIDRLRKNSECHKGHNIGIAHTRWATHGARTDQNAHPHTDAKGRIALVHNGVIENNGEIKKMLIKEAGIQFVSETDTEVIAQLIGFYLDKGLSLLDAVKKLQVTLEGTWGLAIVSRDDPNHIIAARNGSPLVIGIAKDRMFVASEPSAFSRYTKEMISLENGEIAVIAADGNHSLDLKRVEKAETDEITLSPAPYPFWTIKEIMEQPEAISRALNYGGRIQGSCEAKLGGLDLNADYLLKIQHLTIAACGTSLHAGIFGAKLMRWMRSFQTVAAVDAAELSSEDFPREGAGMLAISQSGETKDVHRCLQVCEELSVPKFSVVNAVGSLIARSTKCGVYTNAGREHAVASTKAFTCQVTVLALIGIWFSAHRGVEEDKRVSLVDSLHRLPTNFGQTLRMVQEPCKQIASVLIDKQHLFVLGKGLAEPVAREGALKIKEITYLHAEGTSSGALKHGPFALIEPGTPIILIVLDNAYFALSITGVQEVKTRGAITIVITDNVSKCMAACGDKIIDHVVQIPQNGVLTALLATIPLQLIAYELAVLRGINPDRPRNLAKAVTVF